MSLANVLTVDVRPDRARRYAELCSELAQNAQNHQDPLHWTAFETRIGPSNRLYFVIAAESFGDLESLGSHEEMFVRVLGELRGREWQEEVGSCVASQSQDVSIDRPELSYPPDSADRTAPFALVTVVNARPGQQDACEELIRKVAEAIPKVDDSTRITAYQTILGDLSQYWTIRPLERLADLDRQIPLPELLDRAFGPAEGGLIFRSGLEAMARVERQVVAFRPELSHE